MSEAGQYFGGGAYLSVSVAVALLKQLFPSLLVNIDASHDLLQLFLLDEAVSVLGITNARHKKKGRGECVSENSAGRQKRAVIKLK